MEARKFIKEHGLEVAKMHIGYPDHVLFFQHGNCVVSSVELKRIVESFELVCEHGTIERAKEYANSPYTAPEVSERLKQAIADVESCQ